MTTSRTSRDGEQGVAPVQVRGPVLTVRRIDAYHALTMVAPAIASRFRPGQFVTVAVGGPESSMLLRRAFAIHDVRPDHGGTVEFVFDAAEPGTRWLANRRSRDMLDAVGPLGRPFPVPRESASCLLVGVGEGSTVLFPLADRLRERRCQVDFLLGARSAEHVFGALRARRTARSATITTGDGSLGTRGVVTDMLSQVIHEARTDVIYASAPLSVLRDVTALAGRYDIPVQACVPEAMGCGTGVCMTCVLPVVGSDGITRIVRSCVDGPVFRGDMVRWDDVGSIPFDALGAPGWKPPRTAADPPNGRATPPSAAARPSPPGQSSPAARSSHSGRPPEPAPSAQPQQPQRPHQSQQSRDSQQSRESQQAQKSPRPQQSHESQQAQITFRPSQPPQPDQARPSRPSRESGHAG
jgi:dihydroorotate dehydrogenase electron transfer subunit